MSGSAQPERNWSGKRPARSTVCLPTAALPRFRRPRRKQLTSRYGRGKAFRRGTRFMSGPPPIIRLRRCPCAALAAAKLIRRLGAKKFPLFAPDAAALIHEPGQGFFSCWLVGFLRGEGCLPQAAAPVETPGLVLSGRNILALEAARHNTAAVLGTGVTVRAVPAVDLRLGAGALLKAAGGGRYGCIAAFPDLLPQSQLPKGTDQLAALWEALPPLLAEGGVFIAGFGSTDAERFDRKKPAGFTRLGDIKRKGFRAVACQWTGPAAAGTSG